MLFGRAAGLLITLISVIHCAMVSTGATLSGELGSNGSPIIVVYIRNTYHRVIGSLLLFYIMYDVYKKKTNYLSLKVNIVWCKTSNLVITLQNGGYEILLDI